MTSWVAGVSIRFAVTSSITSDTTADLIVMPRCRSSASESVWVLPSSTLPISSMTPAVYNSRSVSVVLPASTCARIPRFNVRIQPHVLQVDGNLPLGLHEALAHGRLLVALLDGAQQMAPARTNRFV